MQKYVQLGFGDEVERVCRAPFLFGKLEVKIKFCGHYDIQLVFSDDMERAFHITSFFVSV